MSLCALGVLRISEPAEVDAESEESEEGDVSAEDEPAVSWSRP